jgi:hypothetical protein
MPQGASNPSPPGAAIFNRIPLTTLTVPTIAGDVYDIRDKPGWAAVYDELQRAKTVYDGKGSRHVKKGLRVFFDKVRVVRPALNLLPDVEYLSPVVGALQVILDVSLSPSHLIE